jgi:hypothetical protein
MHEHSLIPLGVAADLRPTALENIQRVSDQFYNITVDIGSVKSVSLAGPALALRRLHVRLTRLVVPIYQAHRRWTARRGTLVPPPVGCPMLRRPPSAIDRCRMQAWPISGKCIIINEDVDSIL